MSDSHALALDTSPEARRIQLARWAESSPARKFEMIESLCRDVRALALVGARLRFPHSTQRDQMLRVGALTIEPELMVEAFGWDPEQEGR